MAAAAVVMGILGGASSISGGKQAERDAKAEAKFRRRVGQIEADDVRRETSRLLASQLVAFAGAGVDPSVGTPLDVLGDTVRERELAALRTAFEREAEGLGLEMRGAAARRQGNIGGASTILGAVGQFASSRKDN